MKHRLLITGASGFMGSAVSRALLGASGEIHLVARRNFATPLRGAQIHECNILDDDQRHELIDQVRPTHLLHLAWCTEHGQFWEDPQNAAWQLATCDLVDSFGRAGGQRAVLVGSCAEYDWSTPGPYSETSPTNPATAYGRAKKATAETTMAISRAMDFSLAWAQIFHVFGPGEHPERLVPSICRATRCNAMVELRNPGNVVDLMHIDDVARALLRLLDSTITGRINVASGSATPLWQLRDAVADLADIPGERGHLSHDVGDVITADVTRLRTQLDFSPELDLNSGLKSSLSWWRSRAPVEETAS